MIKGKKLFYNRCFLICMLVCISLLSINVWSLNPSRSNAAEHRQDTPLIILQSSGTMLERSEVGSVSAIFVNSYRPVVSGPNGYTVYEDKGSMLVVIDSTGKQAVRFPTYPVFSLGALSNGNIVVASPIRNNFLHIYSSTGRLLKSFGEINNYAMPDVDNAENQFLRRGKVVIDAADNIYYVFHYIPLIQKYSPDGKLLFERQAQGEAIDMQQELARRFFSTKAPGSVGGIDIINSGAIDHKTGHLWICMNGSSTTGVVYEYGEQGEKIREYALEVDSPVPSARRITGVNDIAVTDSDLYVITSPGVSGAFIFDISNSSPPNSQDVDLTAQPASAAPCGNAQTWNACTYNCAGVTCSGNQPTSSSSDGSNLDCRQALQQTLAPDYTLIRASCSTFSPGQNDGTIQHPRGACKNDITICRNGQNSTASITIDCPPPPSNSCPSGGGGDLPNCIGYWQGESYCGTQASFASYPSTGCPTGYGFDSTSCCCPDNPFSPILVDVGGNGFNLTDFAGGVNFDLNNDGRTGRVAWTESTSDDAWLALDHNGNGKIDNGAELFGDVAPQPQSVTPDGFSALGEFDKTVNGGNRDGRIDSRDAIFSSLRLWQDANHNGISEAGELHTLPSLNISAIDLDYKISRRGDQFGNQFRYRAKVYDMRGAQVGRWAWDVFLRAR
jgi:hypothetical protein